MSADPSMEVFQQILPLLGRDAVLQDFGEATYVELPFDDDEGLGATREPSGHRLISREHLVEEAIEIRCSPVDRRVGLHH